MTRPTAPKNVATLSRRAVVRSNRDNTEVGVAGPICARTSSHLRNRLSEAITTGEGDLVVHLGEAEVWDATGLGVIVGAHHRAAQCGRRLVVADASPRMCRLISGTRLSKVMSVDEDVAGYVPLAATA